MGFIPPTRPSDNTLDQSITPIVGGTLAAVDAFLARGRPCGADCPKALRTRLESAGFVDVAVEVGSEMTETFRFSATAPR
jgi:hypothetical protein